MGFFMGIVGVVDVIAAGALIALFFGHPIFHLQAGMAIALMGKGFLFLPDILSILDIAIGIVMLTLFWIEAPVLALGMAIWLLYKGLYAWL